MGQTAKKAALAIRVTLGRFTTNDDISAFIAELKNIVNSLNKERKQE